MKISRFIVSLVVFLVTLTILVYLFEGFSIDSLALGIVYALALAAFNAYIRPILVRLTLPVTVITLGLFSLVINAFGIILIAAMLPGVEIANFSVAVGIAIGIAIIQALLNGLLAIDDDDAYIRNVIVKSAQRETEVNTTKVPGVIFLEIDGLSHPAIQRALKNAYMPNVSKMLQKTHALTGWECDLASSTPGCQAGILLGSNHNIPAFRWYDRKMGRIVSMGSPKDAAMMETSLTTNRGLLAGGGVSINNMFSGDATVFLLTSSKLLIKGSVRAQKLFFYFFAYPYTFIRTLSLMLVEIFYEIKDEVYQRRQQVDPRLERRRGKYPLVRAVTAVIMRDISVYSIIGSMMRGDKVIYATFVGYDEVAHWAGVERVQAMYVLQQLDKQFAKIARAIKYAPRPYHLVLLSDHGQTQGATYLMRYGKTLEDTVKGLMGKKVEVTGSGDTAESWERINTLGTQAAQDDSLFAGKLISKLTRKHSKQGYVNLAPKESEVGHLDELNNLEGDNVAVLASGNLGLIYFTDQKERLKLEEINRLYPKLIDGLVKHPGIGFVVIDSKSGPIVVSRHGSEDLKSGKIKGTDPLIDFHEPNLRQHILRTHQFDNCPDILLNSFYNAGTDEAAAFEELIGFHGGVGGDQNKPFLLYPKEFASRLPEAIIGAEHLHQVIKAWVPKK